MSDNKKKTVERFRDRDKVSQMWQEGKRGDLYLVVATICYQISTVPFVKSANAVVEIKYYIAVHALGTHVNDKTIKLYNGLIIPSPIVSTGAGQDAMRICGNDFKTQRRLPLASACKMSESCRPPLQTEEYNNVKLQVCSMTWAGV